MLLKLKSTIDTSESSKVMSYLAIVYMICLILQVPQICRLQTTYLVGVSVFGKRKKKSDTVVFIGQYMVLFQKKMLHIFCITMGI